MFESRTKVWDEKRGEDAYINLADFQPSTHALGPGQRAVVWVQGCPFHCPACLAPQWGRRDVFSPVTVDMLVRRILDIPTLDGLTLSGGEPMLQAAALGALIQRVKQQRDVDVICYTGYRYEDLLYQDEKEAVSILLSQIDVLIDGPYVQALDDNCGLRGSSNQNVHFLTSRLVGFDFKNGARVLDVNIRDGELLFVGIPDRQFTQNIDRIFKTMEYGMSGG